MENKFLWLIVGLGIGALAVSLIHSSQNFGIATNSYSYSTATNDVVSCGYPTGTLVLAANTARTSFKASVSTSSVTLCQASSCFANKSGINLTPTTSPNFEQLDGYTGAYYCAGNLSATTSLGITYSN